MNKYYVMTDENGEIIKEFRSLENLYNYWKNSEYIFCQVWVVNKYDYKWYANKLDELYKD